MRTIFHLENMKGRENVENLGIKGVLLLELIPQN
jgi:hypothetical protein